MDFTQLHLEKNEKEEKNGNVDCWGLCKRKLYI
jgi:hypothetical protein